MATSYKISQEQRQEIARQVGRMNILSISGGRVRAIDNGIELPVSNGYSVRIELTAGDDYNVSRIFKRGAKEWVKGTAEGIYFDQVGNFAYYAGMFRSHEADEWVNAAASA